MSARERFQLGLSSFGENATDQGRVGGRRRNGSVDHRRGATGRVGRARCLQRRRTKALAQFGQPEMPIEQHSIGLVADTDDEDWLVEDRPVAQITKDGKAVHA